MKEASVAVKTITSQYNPRQKAFLDSRIVEHPILLSPLMRGVQMMAIYQRKRFVGELLVYTYQELLEMPHVSRIELQRLHSFVQSYDIDWGNERLVFDMPKSSSEIPDLQEYDFLTQTLEQLAKATGVRLLQMWYFIHTDHVPISPDTNYDTVQQELRQRYCWEILERGILAERYEHDVAYPYWPNVPIYFAFALHGFYHDTVLSHELKNQLEI